MWPVRCLQHRRSTLPPCLSRTWVYHHNRRSCLRSPSTTAQTFPISRWCRLRWSRLLTDLPLPWTSIICLGLFIDGPVWFQGCAKRYLSMLVKFLEVSSIYPWASAVNLIASRTLVGPLAYLIFVTLSSLFEVMSQIGLDEEFLVPRIWSRSTPLLEWQETVMYVM